MLELYYNYAEVHTALRHRPNAPQLQLFLSTTNHEQLQHWLQLQCGVA